MADDAKYLRLMHKGAQLRSKLSEMWRNKRSYAGASDFVKDALLQEHFSTSIRDWKGVHVMTIHKSKGKEFDEVIIYEGSFHGKIVPQNADEKRGAQALLMLRVGVTRAMQRTTIVTPKVDVCRFV
jgi:DNA helicase-2/ATP-dependent DNA helicase PcrA